MLVGVGVGVSASGLRGWTPSVINNLSLWLDAQDGSTIQKTGSAVSQWRDKSGFANHASQAVELSKPVYNLSGFSGGGLPYLRFSGDELQIPDAVSLNVSAGMTLFVVCANNAAGSTADSRLFTQWATGNLSVFSSFNNTNSTLALGVHSGSAAQIRSASGILKNTPYVAEINHSGAAAGKVFVNQVSAGADFTVGVNNSSAPFIIGSASAPTADNVDVAEIILYQRLLGADERAAVYAYLNAKWQI